jgi:transposase InsO family protein
MDLADRKIIGWVLSEGMSTEQTTLAALERALKARKAERGLIFHSDRGVQYACNVFKDKLKALKIGVVQSMSRKGNCWDNSAMESFFKTAKSEKFNRYNFKTKQDAKLCVFRYIEGWYNKGNGKSRLKSLRFTIATPPTVCSWQTTTKASRPCITMPWGSSTL